ncbi:MAG: hypothetical protein ABIR47_07435 [Candidatus Kapaibacterium sp.]
MADGPEKQISVIYNNVKDQAFPPDVLQRIGRVMAARAIDLCRERTNRGIDVNGKAFDRYSEKYDVRKRKILSGKARLSSGRRTAFAATEMPNFMRLSGQMFASMRVVTVNVTRSGGELNITFIIGFKDPKYAERAKFNAEKGRDFVGLARPGTQPGQAERRELLAIGKQQLGLSARSHGVVLQEDR